MPLVFRLVVEKAWVLYDIILLDGVCCYVGGSDPSVGPVLVCAPCVVCFGAPRVIQVRGWRMRSSSRIVI